MTESRNGKSLLRKMVKIDFNETCRLKKWGEHLIFLWMRLYFGQTGPLGLEAKIAEALRGDGKVQFACERTTEKFIL